MARGSTKDPHIALIDAYEELERIKQRVKEVMAPYRAKLMRGERLTWEDCQEIERFRQLAIDATLRAQDELAEELESHGLDS